MIPRFLIAAYIIRKNCNFTRMRIIRQKDYS